MAVDLPACSLRLSGWLAHARAVGPAPLRCARRRAHAQVADFGFAVMTERGKKLKLLCGSPHYSAPEVRAARSPALRAPRPPRVAMSSERTLAAALSRPSSPAPLAPSRRSEPAQIFAQQEYVGRAADVWSLGVLVYTMLMGAFPFDAADMAGLRRKVLAGRWDRPLAASKEANDILKRMLVLDPRARCSLEDVMRSAWMRRVSPDFPASFPTRARAPTEPDAAVLDWLAQRGCPPERLAGLARQLREKEKDHLTAAYELLVAKMAGGDVVGGLP